MKQIRAGAKEKETAKQPSLSIVGFDDRSQRHPEGIILPDYMPKHEFFMLIVAPAGCGKTTLILNLLLRIYKNYFHDIVVFSPTIHNDQKWKYLTEETKILRPNPHRKLWEGKVKLKKTTASGEHDKGEEEEGSDKQQDLTPQLQELLKTSMDTFLFESFKKTRGKNGRRQSVKEKKMGKQYLEQWQAWQRLHGQHDARTMAKAMALLKDKQRIQGISMTIAPPTPPKLLHEMRHFQTMLGLSGNSSGRDGEFVVDGDDGVDIVGQGIGDHHGMRQHGRRGRQFNVNYTPLISTSQHNVGGIGGCSGRSTTAMAAAAALAGTPNSTCGIGTSLLHRDRYHQRRRFPHPLSTGERGIPVKGEQAYTYQNGEDNHQHHQAQQYDVDHDIHHGVDKEQRAIGHTNTTIGNKKGQVNPERLFEEYDEDTLDNLMKNQDKVVNYLTSIGKEMTHADHMCFVFDDMVGSGLFNQKRNNAFKRLTVRRRHFCSSVIGVVQAYKEFPKTSRNNTNIYVLFRIESDEELSAIYKDFPCGLKPHVWLAIYKYCTKEPYHFMMINLQTSDPKCRIVRNFDEPIAIPSYDEDQDNWLRQQPFYQQQQQQQRTD